MADVPLIELQDVVKTLGANQVLGGVNLSIRRGEITAIIGKSGSGKSVLLKHIIGLLEPDGGAILFGGRRRSAMSPTEKKALRQKFSYVFQDTALFDFLTVLENVALPLAERKGSVPAEIQRRVRDKLNQLDLYDVDHKYPSQLSGGMKKRVALARALVTDPEIVLFDEPTTGLDPIRKNAVHSMISDYQRRFGFTGVVVSHEIPDIFFIAQRVAMIDGGRIRFEGTPEEIQRASDREVRNFIEGLESPRDEMTGIASQSIGQQHLRQEMGRLQRHQIPFSIVLMAMGNLEDFGRISGHMASQTVLKLFANHVIQNSYMTDTCFRYAIDKIMVVLPDTDEEQARSFCRKISRTLQSKALFDAIASVPGVGCSVRAGVVQARSDSGLDDLIAAVEKGQTILYECRK
ncbi:MAG: ATP-binding cassette domain-containing protein [Desulfobacterales bacterium]|jgi:phospholipid/cholesterol/gamma-HCH transport system ATP-binding protein|nr:ATP-binding cassette domain-containing protein [Desulfobacterales bacterium]